MEELPVREMKLEKYIRNTDLVLEIELPSMVYINIDCHKSVRGVRTSV